MAASRERAQRGADPRDMSLVSIRACSGADGAGVLNTVSDDGFARRADDLDAEAAYYRHRATKEDRALGPGYYIDLLRGMATDWAALAQRVCAGKAAPKGRCYVAQVLDEHMSFTDHWNRAQPFETTHLA
jgi:hypothetical protein